LPRFAELRLNFFGHVLDKVEVHTVGFQLGELISTPAISQSHPRRLLDDRMGRVSHREGREWNSFLNTSTPFFYPSFRGLAGALFLHLRTLNFRHGVTVSFAKVDAAWKSGLRVIKDGN
jgi:hypothetical protein